MFIYIYILFLWYGIYMVYIYIYIYIYNQGRIFRSSYRRLAGLGFDPTITEFCSDALTTKKTL